MSCMSLSISEYTTRADVTTAPRHHRRGRESMGHPIGKTAQNCNTNHRGNLRPQPGRITMVSVIDEQQRPTVSIDDVDQRRRRASTWSVIVALVAFVVLLLVGGVISVELWAVAGGSFGGLG